MSRFVMGTLILTSLAVGRVSGQPVTRVSKLGLVPWPSKVVAGSGVFVLTSQTHVFADSQLASEATKLIASLEPASGFHYAVETGDPGYACIAFRYKSDLPREAYRLEVRPQAIQIQASTPEGAFYGFQTLRQALPPEIFAASLQSGVEWSVPALTVEDSPRFAWRGSHLDVCRHFFPKEFVKRYIDLLAIHKMNRFHWHLSDDQGWRLQIRRYPRLTEVGGFRSGTLIGHHQKAGPNPKMDPTRYGGFYTQDDVREVVAYAAERHVTVVPEIEMPGHSQAAVAAYPELGCTSEKVETRTVWGVSPYLLNSDPATVEFMQNVLAEVIELFPSPWIHVGGDEALKNQWKANPKIQAHIKQLGLKTEDELQSWFIRQMDTFLTSKGRRLVGWDEILDGGLAPGATVMDWHGYDRAKTAAEAGHDVVMAPSEFTYFDYYQSRNIFQEPLAIGGYTPLEKIYGWEPLQDPEHPKTAPDSMKRHVLGVQAQLWSEYLPDPKAVEYMAFPRMCALAEVGWTPAAERKFGPFQERLQIHERRLRQLNVNFRP